MVRSVLMFCPQFRPIVGGAKRQAEKLANALGLRLVKLRFAAALYKETICSPN